MTLRFTLTTTDTDAGPFNLFSDVNGFVYAFATNVSKETLISGYTSNNVPDGTLIVKVVSVGQQCQNSIDIEVNADDCFEGFGFDNNIHDLRIQNDEKIIVGGRFTTYGLTSSNRIARLNSDGSYDTTFNILIGIGGTEVYETIIQPDGKIVILGNFTTYQGSSASRLIRVNTDGSIDTSFIFGTGLSGAGSATIAYCGDIQSDNKLLIGGQFTSYNGVSLGSTRRLMRLEVNGTLDNSFIPYSTVGTFTYDFKIQSDGKIIAGGSGSVRRYNSDGSQDLLFTIGLFTGSYVYSVNLQINNKIIIAGRFTIYNGNNYSNIIRLNSDGTTDTTFIVGDGFNSEVRSTAIQSDGKIIVVGYFTSYKNISYNRIIRLNLDGSIDTSFNIGVGFNNDTEEVTILSNGKILVGGRFTTYNGESAIRIVKLNSDGSFDNCTTTTSTTTLTL